MSVFTMAENATQLKETDVFVNPTAQFDSNPIYKKIIDDKNFKRESSQKSIKVVDELENIEVME